MHSRATDTIKCCLFSIFITDHYVGVRSRFYKHPSAGPFGDRHHVLCNEVLCACKPSAC